MSGPSPRGIDEHRHSDVVIVGSGVAGLSVALATPDRRITILSKSPFAGGGSSVHAQGGVAVALGLDDSPSRHARDTLAAGAGLCDVEVVRLVTEEGPRRMKEILALGALFDRDAEGRLALGREAAHSRRRVVHAAGDATGAELVRALARAAISMPGVVIDEEVLALDLVVDGGRVVGVIAARRDGRLVMHSAAAVVLATGGVGQIFRHTTNPSEATGDGLAMAIRAGARVAGLEFVQFHPTALAVDGNPMPLLTEALRGEGAVLLDERGSRFMTAVHADAELAPRDVVARAIWRHLQDGHQVSLDATALEGRFERRFPTVLELCLSRGLDPRRRPIPVAPAAHYHMGGVAVDHHGRTSLEGLWACGEVAHTGLHGANRLASNSLLEALVYGARVGERLRLETRRTPARARLALDVRMPSHGSWFLDEVQSAQADRIREIMWTGVGLERTAPGLRDALRDIESGVGPLEVGAGELGNLRLVARMVARAAWARTESRGAHFRTDIPWRDPHWQQHLYFDGETLVEPQPIAVAG